MKQFLFCLLLLSLSALTAQPPSRFYTTFGGDGDDIGYSTKVTLDRQYIVTGSTSSYGSHGNTDAYLVKVDSFGVALWQKFIGGTGNDVGKSVIQLPDSGYVITGFTNSFGAGGYDAYIVKTDKDGNTIWQNTFGGTDWDFANDLVLAPDGNIVIVGYTSSFGSGYKDGFAVKFDPFGNKLWQKFYGGTANEELRSVIKTNDNFLAAVGYTESRGDANGDGYFLKLDLNGDTIFTRTFGGMYKDYGNDIVQQPSNAYVICGAKTYTINGTTDALMYCIDSNGSFSWENHYKHRTEGDEFSSVTTSNKRADLLAFVKPRPITGFKLQDEITVVIGGGYLYSGCTYTNGNIFDCINSSGGTEDELVFSVEPTKDKGYISVGSTKSFNSLGTDVYFIKMDSTILNYSSVVGVPEIQKRNTYKILYQDESILMSFPDRDAEAVTITELTGKTVGSYLITTENSEISTLNLPGSIYVLTLQLKNGTSYHEKFIHK